MKTIVLVPQYLTSKPLLFSPIREVLDAVAKLVEYDPSKIGSLKANLQEAVGVIGGRCAQEDMLSIAPKLRIVACYSVRYDGCDVDAMTRYKVYLTHTPGVLTDGFA